MHIIRHQQEQCDNVQIVILQPLCPMLILLDRGKCLAILCTRGLHLNSLPFPPAAIIASISQHIYNKYVHQVIIIAPTFPTTNDPRSKKKKDNRVRVHCYKRPHNKHITLKALIQGF